MSAKLFFCRFYLKREDDSLASSIKTRNERKKTFGQHLVFRFWFLATGRSNEKNINLEKGLHIKLCDEETPATHWTKTCKKVLKPNIKGKQKHINKYLPKS